VIDEQAPAIVLGGGLGNGVGIARNLGRHDIPVYCLTSNPFETTCYSRYCQGYHIVPHVEDDPHVLRHTLQQFAHRYPGPTVLYPTTDSVVLTLATLQNSLNPFVVVMPPRHIAETLVVKTAFYQSLQVHGVPHPRTLLPSEHPVHEMIEHLTFPVYIRPAQSLRFHQRFHRKGFVAHNISELGYYLQRAEHAELAVMVQEVIPGPATLGYLFQGYFDKASQPIVIVASQKLRQRSMFANSSAEVSIPWTKVPQCIQILVDYFQAIGYRGLFGAEFKQDPRDGTFKLLEVNARSMGGNAHSTACGANDILAAYRDALNRPIAPITQYTVGIHSAFFINDLKTLMVCARQRSLTMREVLAPYRSPNQLGVLARNDPLPFIIDIVSQAAQKLPWLSVFARSHK
jgi:predicted ATP-grasp superfamily ATP-dependent carboligase